MNLRSVTLVLILVLTPIATAGAARGATFCVSSSFGLQSALNQAATNSQSDTIRVRTGSYEAPPGGFTYWESASDHGYSVDIVGGWSGTRGCKDLTPDPQLTTLDGSGHSRVLRIEVGDESAVRVRFFTFVNGRPEGEEDSGCGAGLYVSHKDYDGSGYYPHARRVEVEHNWFILNETAMGGGLCVAWSRLIEVDENVFLANHAKILGGAMMLQNGEPDDGESWASIFVANNTVLSNTVDYSYPGGIAITTGDYALLANNIVWGNSNSDIGLGFLGAPADRLDVRLLHNNFRWYSTGSPNVNLLTFQGNILDVAPAFESGWFNYTPKAGSPLIDGGVNPGGGWGVPGYWFPLSPLDFYGNPRVVNDQVDIGAVEVQASR